MPWNIQSTLECFASDVSLSPPLQVPRCAPTTRALHGKWSAIWPLSWCPPSKGVAPDDEATLPPDDRAIAAAAMDAAFVAAAEAAERCQVGRSTLLNTQTQMGTS